MQSIQASDEARAEFRADGGEQTFEAHLERWEEEKESLYVLWLQQQEDPPSEEEPDLSDAPPQFQHTPRCTEVLLSQ